MRREACTTSIEVQNISADVFRAAISTDTVHPITCPPKGPSAYPTHRVSICKRFNDNRRCSGADNPRCGGVHDCDVILETSRLPCGKKDHKRTKESRTHMPLAVCFEPHYQHIQSVRPSVRLSARPCVRLAIRPFVRHNTI